MLAGMRDRRADVVADDGRNVSMRADSGTGDRLRGKSQLQALARHAGKKAAN